MESFDPEVLRRAAAAHVSDRLEGRRVSRDLALAVEAAAEAGMSMQEIDAIIAKSSRRAIEERRLAA